MDAFLVQLIDQVARECHCMYSAAVLATRGGPTGAVQLKQLASAYSQQKHMTWAVRGQIIIVNCLSCTAPVVPPLTSYIELTS